MENINPPHESEALNNLTSRLRSTLIDFCKSIVNEPIERPLIEAKLQSYGAMPIDTSLPNNCAIEFQDRLAVRKYRDLKNLSRTVYQSDSTHYSIEDAHGNFNLIGLYKVS